jgi:hypothetical protein
MSTRDDNMGGDTATSKLPFEHPQDPQLKQGNYSATPQDHKDPRDIIKDLGVGSSPFDVIESEEQHLHRKASPREVHYKTITPSTIDYTEVRDGGGRAVDSPLGRRRHLDTLLQETPLRSERQSQVSSGISRTHYDPPIFNNTPSPITHGLVGTGADMSHFTHLLHMFHDLQKGQIDESTKLELKRLALEQQRLEAEKEARDEQIQRDENFAKLLSQQYGVKERRIDPNSFPRGGMKWPPSGFSLSDVSMGVVPGFVVTVLDWARNGIATAGAVDPDTASSFRLTGDWFSSITSQIRLQLRTDCKDYDDLVVWLDNVRDQIIMQRGANSSLTDCDIWHMMTAAFYEKFALMTSGAWVSTVMDFMPNEGEAIRSYTQRFYSHVKAARNAVGQHFIPDEQLQNAYFRGLEYYYRGASTELSSVLRQAKLDDGLTVTVSVPLSGGGAPIIRCNDVDTLVRYALNWLNEYAYTPTKAGISRMSSRVGTAYGSAKRGKTMSVNETAIGDDDVDCQELKTSSSKKDQVCRAFQRTGNCRYGRGCIFKHTRSSDSSSTSTTSFSTSSPSSSSSSSSARGNYGSKQCPQWEKGYCMYGTTCRYDHTVPCPNCGQRGHPWALCLAAYANVNGTLTVATDGPSFTLAKKERMDWVQNQLRLLHPTLNVTQG